MIIDFNHHKIVIDLLIQFDYCSPILFLWDKTKGGACAENDSDWTYENGFLFADANEAYVLETAGRRHWCLERIEAGNYRNISNGLSIRTNWLDCCASIQEIAKTKGWWDGVSKFDWKACVGNGGAAARGLQIDTREGAVAAHLEAISKDAQSGVLNDDAVAWCKRAAKILRDEESGVCFRDVHGFCSTGSQISWIPKNNSSTTSSSAKKSIASHLFTAASDPLGGTCYKRFTFADVMLNNNNNNNHNNNNNSLELWRKWRQLSLSGGLESLKSPKSSTIAKKLIDEEKQAMHAVASENAPDDKTKTFSAAIQREMSLWEELT